jgi:ketosteroid isomerase-like protein
MYSQRNEKPSPLFASEFSRRRFAAWGAGVALPGIALGMTRNGTLALEQTATTDDADDLEQAIQQMRAATTDFINGKTDAWKAMCSHRDDATLFGGWGGYERGWEQLGPRYDWAAARFAGGEVTFEEIARYVTSDLACTIHFERMQARLAGGDQIVPVNLRVNHIYRREDGRWKLIHRHADALVAIQETESVVDD